MDPQQKPPAADSPEPRQLDLNDPFRVTNVVFEGVHRTRPKLLAKMVAEVFESKTLLEFAQLSIQVQDKLHQLNAFQSIEIRLRRPNPEELDNYEVLFVVAEKGRVKASANTAIDEQTTHLDLRFWLPNMTGRGDSMELSSKFNKRFFSGEYRASIPLAPWRQLWAPKYSIAFNQCQWDATPSKYDQEDRAVLNQLEFMSDPETRHALSFENTWRHISASSPTLTPLDIREQCGHSVKSSLKHSVTRDTRLGGNFPYTGYLAKLTNEITTNLVAGGAKFMRSDVNLQTNTLLIPRYDLLLQLNLLAGTLLRPRRVNICDKFFAGGPLTVRGFELQGIGPSVAGCPLGDLSYLSSGLHLYSILPFTTPESSINEFLRPHLFFNIGTIGNVHNLARLTSTEAIKKQVTRIKDSLRYSAGLGLVLYIMKLRLEVNYCLPLVAKDGDVQVKGIQWGFGLSYT